VLLRERDGAHAVATELRERLRHRPPRGGRLEVVVAGERCADRERSLEILERLPIAKRELTARERGQRDPGDTSRSC
jgi:hypothetical protein